MEIQINESFEYRFIRIIEKNRYSRRYFIVDPLCWNICIFVSDKTVFIQI